jgi:hypothetical protein
MMKVVYKNPFYSEFIDLIIKDNPYRTYNSEEYDLVPKKELIEKQIKERESLIKRMNEQKAEEIKCWDNGIELIQRELEHLKGTKS